ncbi:MAG: hypothetical protein QOH26_523 [Actinomycetota bacterium]|jgi:uncharacterized protein (TIGR03083 family)|nr:hypothetical protein [Actinomycetota bacterium]
MDIWDGIHTERVALLEDLRSLSAEQWGHASLCDRWTVQDVAAHLTSITDFKLGDALTGMLRSGFNFNKMNADDAHRRSAPGPEAIMAKHEEGLDNRTHPVAVTEKNVIVDTVVHGQDIRRPLGLTRDFPEETLVTVANILKGYGYPVNGKKRIRGLRLQATDVDWSTGEGPLVEGPLEALVMVIAGRKAALADVSGEGKEILSSR